MEDFKTQKVSVRLPMEDYGWIMRYGAKNDLTVSQVIRKAVRLFIVATAKKLAAKKE